MTPLLVKVNMPRASFLSMLIENTTARYGRLESNQIACLRRMALDSTWIYGIIIFTYSAAKNRITNAQERPQTRSLARRRIFESAAPGRNRSALCQRQLLRSQGSGSSQVRDAASRAERGPLGHSRRDGFRLLAPLVLSSFVGPRAGWAGRI